MKAILLIDHGSTRQEANHMLECMAHLLQRMAGDDVAVHYGHMELAEPSIGAGYRACVAGGATEVVVFPYMLSPGRHSTSDIPRMVAEVAREFPGVSYQVTQAFGIDAGLGDIILRRAGISAADANVAAEACCWNGDDPPGACGEACTGQKRNGVKAD